jgi:hypothetical protein
MYQVKTGSSLSGSVISAPTGLIPDPDSRRYSTAR